jgi:hypothetical protein
MRKALVTGVAVGAMAAAGGAAAMAAPTGPGWPATSGPSRTAGLQPVAGAAQACRTAAGSVPGAGTVTAVSRGADGWHVIVVNPDGDGYEVTLSLDGDLLQVGPYPGDRPGAVATPDVRTDPGDDAPGLDDATASPGTGDPDDRHAPDDEGADDGGSRDGDGSGDGSSDSDSGPEREFDPLLSGK